MRVVFMVFREWYRFGRINIGYRRSFKADRSDDLWLLFTVKWCELNSVVIGNDGSKMAREARGKQSTNA